MSGLVRLKRLDLGSRRRGFGKASLVSFKVNPRLRLGSTLNSTRLGFLAWCWAICDSRIALPLKLPPVVNTDIISRTGYDHRALQAMIDDLGLVGCADARWPASSCVFKTHKGDEAHTSSHLDYILISKHSATAVRRFGIDADRDLMVDFDHAVLFADIGMCQVLGLKRTSPQPQVSVRRKSTIRYSDKQ